MAAFPTKLGEVVLRETSDAGDLDKLWELMLQPVFAEGVSFCLPTDVSKEDALAYWAAPGHRVFVVEIGKGKERKRHERHRGIKRQQRGE